MDYMLIEGDWLGTFEPGDRLAECGLPAPSGGKLGQRWDGSAWVDAPDAAERATQRLAWMAKSIADERERLTCRRWQLQLALGEARWGEVEAFLASDSATWAMRQIFSGITQLPRVSETADLIGYILGLDDSGLDNLWRLAAAEVA
jgi:hypothetical protein